MIADTTAPERAGVDERGKGQSAAHEIVLDRRSGTIAVHDRETD